MTKAEVNILERAAAIIRTGGLVALPTETVYGLAADATSDDAVARIFEAKARPQFNPLIVHVADARMAQRYVEWPALAGKLARAFWPGPLTLVLPRLSFPPLTPAEAGVSRNENARLASRDPGLRRDERKEEARGISLLVSAGLDTLGVRAPDHAIAQKLIRTADRPLAAPSANISGTISPTSAAHVRASLSDKVDMVLDGGPCAVGLESTIVKIDRDDAVLLRPGGAAREAIEAVIGGRLKTPAKTARPEAPGMLTSHYAPRARLRLNVDTPEKNEAFLAFGACRIDGPYVLNLSASGELREAAANLFAHLRALDDKCAAQGFQGIAVAPVPKDGIGEAINDRLARAAAARN